MDDWDASRVDPDPEEDLGYRIAEWDVIRHRGNGGQVVFLPCDEDMLRDEAFIIAEEDAVSDLVTMI